MTRSERRRERLTAVPSISSPIAAAWATDRALTATHAHATAARRPVTAAAVDAAIEAVTVAIEAATAAAPPGRIGKNPGFYIKNPAQWVFLVFLYMCLEERVFRVFFSFKNTFRCIQTFLLIYASAHD